MLFHIVNDSYVLNTKLAAVEIFQLKLFKCIQKHLIRLLCFKLVTDSLPRQTYTRRWCMWQKETKIKFLKVGQGDKVRKQLYKQCHPNAILNCAATNPTTISSTSVAMTTTDASTVTMTTGHTNDTNAGPRNTTEVTISPRGLQFLRCSRRLVVSIGLLCIVFRGLFVFNYFVMLSIA